MHTAHIPDGSFKRILSRRRKDFPKLSFAELDELGRERGINWGSRPELADLRTMPEFADLCSFTDAVCEFIGIPPVNLYWFPFSPIITGFLTSQSNTVVLMGDIQNVHSRIIDALVGHELGEGIQGDLEEHIYRPGEIGEAFARRKEMICDTFSMLVSTSQSVEHMLFHFEQQLVNSKKESDPEKALELVLKTVGNYPGLMLRRISILDIQLSQSWRDFVLESSNSDKLLNIIFSKDPAKRGVHVLTDPEDKRRGMEMVRAAPFYNPSIVQR